jgi:putative endonuclease
MAKHNELGKLGEQLAIKHLRGKGFQILEVNWYFGHHEIDIIARDGEMLVVVEVKTRATDVFGEPEMAVNKQKQRSIVKAADAYLQQHDLNIETRFDVVSVIITPNERRIFHIDDAFYPIM